MSVVDKGPLNKIISTTPWYKTRGQPTAIMSSKSIGWGAIAATGELSERDEKFWAVFTSPSDLIDGGEDAGGW
jgi:hypothetical protein